MHQIKVATNSDTNPSSKHSTITKNKRQKFNRNQKKKKEKKKAYPVIKTNQTNQKRKKKTKRIQDDKFTWTNPARMVRLSWAIFYWIFLGHFLYLTSLTVGWSKTRKTPTHIKSKHKSRPHPQDPVKYSSHNT